MTFPAALPIRRRPSSFEVINNHEARFATAKYHTNPGAECDMKLLALHLLSALCSPDYRRVFLLHTRDRIQMRPAIICKESNVADQRGGVHRPILLFDNNLAHPGGSKNRAAVDRDRNLSTTMIKTTATHVLDRRARALPTGRLILIVDDTTT
ncbi:unnamed protein product [Fusarium equiseti]|uniref:Uncharacterized protein n=1 Tax=Fusarium equiseti TaxID=61235 RepID=A0A8J2N9X9_FUSEQ|nr:unnamed protein product [Fusarium equiseti]